MNKLAELREKIKNLENQNALIGKALIEIGDALNQLEVKPKVNYVTYTGTFWGGFSFYGPFTSKTEAEEWAKDTNFHLNLIQLKHP